MGPDGDLETEARWPAVAFAKAAGEYLVAWNGRDGTPPMAAGEDEIFGQRIDAATGAEVGENDFRISDMGPDGDEAFEANRPSVAYNPVDDEYLVVWQGEDDIPPLINGDFEVFGQRLDAITGAELGANDFRVSHVGEDGNTTQFAGFPELVHNPADNEYLVLWPSDDTTHDEYEMYVQRIDGASGADIGANLRVSDMGPDGDPIYDALRPAIAYNSIADEYLVAWSGDDDTGALVDDEREIFGQRLDPDPLGMAVGGATLDRVACRNLATGERASGPPASTTWTCAELDVAASVGQRAVLIAAGVADSTGPLAGAMSGLDVSSARVTCQNLTTAQTLQFALGADTWDCEAQGLVVSEGDRIRLTVSGEA